ncbi:hypothetical protein BVRB_4g072460 isoform B [Beta vulgaris subsp. vulgaris]|nr:hypothetical protein BVRB_4g072460 isoform B [Beta vulgaris subsp. vulgaris]
MEDDSSLLDESTPNSSYLHEITPVVNPTIVVQAQQQLDISVEMSTVSNEDDSEIPLSSCMKWYLLKVLVICGLSYAIGSSNRIIPNVYNLVAIPWTMTVLILTGVINKHYEDVARNLLVLLLPICVTFVVIVVGTLVFPIAVILLPWLVVSFSIARLLQFIRYGDEYDNVTALKLCIRAWIYQLYLFSIAPALALLLTVAWYAPNLRLQFYKVEGMLLTDWQHICSAMSGMFICSILFLIVALYFIPRLQLDHSESGINIPEAVLEIADCLNVFFWLKLVTVNTIAPHVLKHHRSLELETWKWFQVSIFMVIIYNVITLSTHIIVWLLQKLVCRYKLVPETTTEKNSQQNNTVLKILLRRRYIVYWGNGMKHNITFVLTSLFFLLAWVLVFRSQLDETPKARKIYEFGTWTSLSFLVCAFLWLIKTCVILFQEASSIYIRLQSNILQGGKQLYFLGMIGRHSFDIFNLMYHDDMPNIVDENGMTKHFVSVLRHLLNLSLAVNLNTHYHTKSDVEDEWENEKRLSKVKKERAKEYLLMVQDDPNPTIYAIQQVALYFVIAKDKLWEEKYSSIILQKLHSYNQDRHTPNSGFEEMVKRLIGEENWNDFQHQLDENMPPSEAISFEAQLKAWMEMAHNNCLFVANTLSSAKEVVDCLDKIISSFLIFATFIMWLLLTGLATTQVLVLITTPLFAVTFIFQNTCKTFFDGLMFAYVVHPFSVGDLCIIDEKMMEVRTVGVWRTTFTKVSTQEKVIYSNSELSHKSIINHKTQFDWNDAVELNVGSLDAEKIKNLKQVIERYLDGDKDKFKQGYNSVDVLTTELDSMKLTVYLKHKVKLQNQTFFECLKEKRKLRSEFILYIENLVDRYKNGISSS